MPDPDRHPGAGFTLLEILAALVILGMILAGLAGAIRFGELALQTQTRETVAADDIVPVEATLRALVEHAWPDPGDADARFQGTAHTLSFRTVLPISLTSVPIRDADVSIGVDSAHRLYLLWLPWYRHWLVAKAQPQRIDLLANVDRLDVEYWDPSLHLPPNTWVSAWVGNTTPRLLRIRLVLAKGAGPRWPDIIVATERDRFVF
jgi:general secretion pathway protein J